MSGTSECGGVSGSGCDVLASGTDAAGVGPGAGRGWIAGTPRPVVRLEWARWGRSVGESGHSLMNGQFSVEMVHTQPVSVVRPDGVLDAYTAADLRVALLECVAEQPAGLVIDVSTLSVADDVGLTVVAAVAQQAARWPGTRLIIAGASHDLVHAARTLGVLGYVTFCPDLAAAKVEVGQWPVPPRRQQQIPPDRNAPGVARTVVQEFCAAEGVRGEDAAQLVASELVTNAVLHAGTPIDLTLRLIPPMLHIAVRDGGDGEARLSGIVDESSESGRGLLLVDALAAAWGSFLPHTGKIVWATVRVRKITHRNQGAAGLPE